MTRHKVWMVTVAVFLAGLLPVIKARAMIPVQARDLSMGMSSAADAVGVRIVGYNPAFLGFSDQPYMTIAVPGVNVGVRFGNNAFTNQDIALYFQKSKHLDLEDLQYLADRVGERLIFTTDVFTRILGISFPARYLTMAFTYDMGLSIDARFDNEFTDLALLGNPVDNLGQQKQFEKSDFSGIWLSRVGFTFAKNFRFAEDVDWMDEFTGGVTFNYFIGHAFIDVSKFNASFLTDYDGTTSHAYVEVVGAGRLSNESDDDFYSTDFAAGSGVGLDLGIGAKVLQKRGTVGFSVINLINEMTWSNGRRAIYSMNVDGLPFGGFNKANYWEDNFEPVDSLLQESQNLTTDLPRQFRLDGAYRMAEPLTVTSGITVQTNDVIGADSFFRMGGGIDYRSLDWLSIRSGISVGGRSGLAFGAGVAFRVGIWQTDLGLGWEHGLFDFAKGMRFGLSTILIFDRPAEEPTAEEKHK